jgi:hypothetical protein
MKPLGSLELVPTQVNTTENLTVIGLERLNSQGAATKETVISVVINSRRSFPNEPNEC